MLEALECDIQALGMVLAFLVLAFCIGAAFYQPAERLLLESSTKEARQ